MKKTFRVLTAFALAAAVLSFGACDKSNAPGEDPGDEDRPIFGITARPENDFDQDSNRHDRKPVQRTLKLKGGATFADGTTEKILDSGNKLVVGTDINLTVPEGKVLCGWLADDSDDAGMYGDYYGGADFKTLRKDATISPVFDVPADSYAPTNVKVENEQNVIGFGKIPGFAWEQRTGSPQTSADAFICKDTLTSLTVNGELGSYFHVKGGTIEQADATQKVRAGWHTLFLSKYQVVKEQAYGVTYTIQNFGDEAIDVRMYQTNSSGSPMPAGSASAPVHLEQGESDRVFISFSNWTNGNILSSLELLNSVSELKVGVYGYISDYADAQEYKLEVTQGSIASAENATSADIKAGTAVQLSYEHGDADKLFLGWQDFDKKANKYPDRFVMPDKNLKLEPWVENKADHKHTVTLSGDDISFAGGGKTKEICYTDELDLSDIVYTGTVKPGWKIIYRITDDNGSSEKYNTDKFTMPDNDITVEFVKVDVVWNATDGKVTMAPFSYDLPDPSNNNRIRESLCSMAPTGGDITVLTKKFTPASQLDMSASIVDLDGEEAAKYHLVGYNSAGDAFTETIASGARFMQQINHNAVKGAYTNTVTVKNLGTETIKIRVHSTLSSGSYNRDGSSDVIEIAAGETKTFSYDVNFGNDNSSEFITIEYVGETAISDMTLAMYMYRNAKA